jgi:hypothetical protein
MNFKTINFIAYKKDSSGDIFMNSTWHKKLYNASFVYDIDEDKNVFVMDHTEYTIKKYGHDLIIRIYTEELVNTTTVKSSSATSSVISSDTESNDDESDEEESDTEESDTEESDTEESDTEEEEEKKEVPIYKFPDLFPHKLTWKNKPITCSKCNSDTFQC